MNSFKAWLQHCHKVLQHPAHQAERPFHFCYFVSIAYYYGGFYGLFAICCGAVTIISWGDNAS